MTNWIELMADNPTRLLFEAGLGALFALLAWALGEFTPAKRLPPEGKKFFPALAALVGIPLSAILAALIPGVIAKELVPLMVSIGGVGSHLIHGAANSVAGKTPKDPPGSPGDGDSIEGGK